MADYRLWGRIEQIGPREFVAIASAIPDESDPKHARVVTRLAVSLSEAQDALRGMLVDIGRPLDATGDRVVDTEADGL